MTYRDAAIAAHEAETVRQEAERNKREEALVRDARKAADSLFEKDGVPLDPIPETKVLRVDLENRLVVFEVDDGSEISFAVHARGGAVVYLVKWKDGQPVQGPVVKTLADVGEALTGEEG